LARRKVGRQLLTYQQSEIIICLRDRSLILKNADLSRMHLAFSGRDIQFARGPFIELKLG
jgi:hypothetical protein